MTSLSTQLLAAEVTPDDALAAIAALQGATSTAVSPNDGRVASWSLETIDQFDAAAASATPLVDEAVVDVQALVNGFCT